MLAQAGAQAGGQDGFALTCLDDGLAPGVEDGGVAGEVVALLVGAGLVGRDDVDLVLNSAGARQGLPVAQAAGRPGGGQEEYGDVLEREFADELGKRTS